MQWDRSCKETMDASLLPSAEQSRRSHRQARETILGEMNGQMGGWMAGSTLPLWVNAAPTVLTCPSVKWSLLKRSARQVFPAADFPRRHILRSTLPSPAMLWKVKNGGVDGCLVWIKEGWMGKSWDDRETEGSLGGTEGVLEASFCCLPQKCIDAGRERRFPRGRERGLFRNSFGTRETCVDASLMAFNHAQHSFPFFVFHFCLSGRM